MSNTLGRLEDLPPAYRDGLRPVVEGEGAWPTVDGERYPMERGDLILTSTGLWPMLRYPWQAARAALVAPAADPPDLEAVQVTCVNPESGADAPAFPFVADEAPPHRKLGVYEVRV